ncbi:MULTISPECIES: TetR/AcrR family transcriptional regulator [unclassified Streptomyces]|uniref:TetR/AcrR family transcriptional regulator n=1 Tax=unclassified Streptomyces TaxID=2593676 RepID=UPI001E4C6DD1|nr:TetR/AcrR family transcriptional regulator [Streptomyces sp. CB02980]MCB8907667.1 TetR/AcrR family transcriptional regulator [Streptomyces sp. CB02980]
MTESGTGGTGKTRRRRRSREETEADLLAAARTLLERDGVLAGVNLREIAAEAGVNHGQIYQYFGSRQSLLRAAAADLVERQTEDHDGHWEQPFAERRLAMFHHRLDEPELVTLETLLALDRDDNFSPLPRFPQTLQSLDRDKADGSLPEDADAVAAHVMTAAAQMGYVIFREAYARDTGIPLDELDERAAQAFSLMIAGLAAPSSQQTPQA